MAPRGRDREHRQSCESKNTIKIKQLIHLYFECASSEGSGETGSPKPWLYADASSTKTSYTGPYPNKYACFDSILSSKYSGAFLLLIRIHRGDKKVDFDQQDSSDTS